MGLEVRAFLDKMQNKSDVRLTVGISDHWSKEERKAGNVSSSGAKLYVQIEKPHAGNTLLRDAALARVADLFQEETVEACDYLWVERRAAVYGGAPRSRPLLAAAPCRCSCCESSSICNLEI